MAIPLWTLLLVYVVFLIIFVIYSFFNIFHLYRFAPVTIKTHILVLLYLLIAAAIFIITAYYLLQIDWTRSIQLTQYSNDQFLHPK